MTIRVTRSHHRLDTRGALLPRMYMKAFSKMGNASMFEVDEQTQVIETYTRNRFNCRILNF
jgi:hypothetical protein